jgi:hypothetical protein
MSLAMGHFAAGASAAFVVLNILPFRIRRKVPDYGFLGITAGFWAMIPDLSKFVIRLSGFHDSIWANFFFFHQIMDLLDVHDSVWVVIALIGFMLLLMLTLWANDFWQRKTQ